MKKFIVFVNPSKYDGYSIQALAAAKYLEKKNYQVEICDLSLGEGALIEDNAIFLSCGPIGYDAAIMHGGVPPNSQWVVLTDRVSFLTKPFGDNLTLIAPQNALDKVEAHTKISCDVVSVLSRDRINNDAYAFAVINKETLPNVDDASFTLVGGRVQLPNGSWGENITRDYAKLAELVAINADGKDICVYFHQRATSNIVNGFKIAYNDGLIAFCEALKKHVDKKQKMTILVNRGDCVMLYKLFVDGVAITKLRSDDFVYNWFLQKAVASGNHILFTAEHMNFTPEALELGADYSMLIPVGSKDGWSMCLPDNEATHEDIRLKKQKGEKLVSQIDALKMLF